MNETENNAKGQKHRIGLMVLIGVAIAILFIIPLWFVLHPPRKEPYYFMGCEGKGFIADIATAIRAYAAEQGADGQLPEDNDFEVFGFPSGYLDGTGFNQSTDKMFSFTVVSLNPLKFTVTAVNKNLDPNIIITLDQDGTWTEKTE